MELTVTASVVIPEAPDHLVTDGGMRLPLSAISREDLKRIAQKWTSDLLEKHERQGMSANKAPASSGAGSGIGSAYLPPVWRRRKLGHGIQRNTPSGGLPIDDDTPF